jgi:hypothetical protein
MNSRRGVSEGRVVSREESVRLKAARAFDAAPASWQVQLHESPPDDADVVVTGPDMDAPSGIAFDPDHPEDLLDRVLRAAAPTAGGSGVVVTGSGGGAGVTTVALHLSSEAASRGAEVLYADLDLSWGAPSRLGLSPDVRTWADVGDTPPSLQLAAVPVPGRFRALFSPGSAVSAVPVDLVTRAVGEFRHVVVDAPSLSPVPELMSSIRTGVLVVSPTAPAARRAREVLESYPECRWAIVSNRTGPGGETTRSGLERILDRKVALELPCTPALRDAEDGCRLLAHRWSRWARGISRLWRALEAA